MSRRFTLHSHSNMRGSGSFFTPAKPKVYKRATYRTKGEGLRPAGARPNPQVQKMWRARQQAAIQRRSAAMAKKKREQKDMVEKKVPLKQEGEGLARGVRVALEDNPLETGHSELKRSLMKFGQALKKKKKKKAKIVKPAQKLKAELLKLASKQ